jgi:hypothetical protein
MRRRKTQRNSILFAVPISTGVLSLGGWVEETAKVRLRLRVWLISQPATTPISSKTTFT